MLPADDLLEVEVYFLSVPFSCNTSRPFLMQHKQDRRQAEFDVLHALDAVVYNTLSVLCKQDCVPGKD